jgi:sec-independent protein translocase protein TatC
MTLASETESPEQAAAAPESGRVRDPEFPYEVEMTLMEHLEELRSRLLASVIAVAICIIACFAVVNRIVALLEVPARGVTFLQLAPGEYFFVSVKVAAYSGLLLATPFLLCNHARQIIVRGERDFQIVVAEGDGKRVQPAQLAFRDWQRHAAIR